jgi:hypothetical protein
LQRTVYKEGDEVIVVTQQDVEGWVHYTRVMRTNSLPLNPSFDPQEWKRGPG